MQHLFVEHPLAVMLKEAGFNEPCVSWFIGEILHVDHHFYGSDLKESGFKEEVVRAPIYQQVFDWLEGKGFDIQVRRVEGGYVCVVEDFVGYMMYPLGDENKLTVFQTRKHAWNKAVVEALKLLKEKSA